MRDPRTQRRLWALGIVLSATAALACASYSPAPPPRGGAAASYRVGPPDLLRVVVLPAPEIVRDARVRPDGMISLDLVGDVPAGGRTLDEISADIERRMSRFKRDAAATVSLVDAQSTAITVFGEVRAPGAFPLVKDTRVAEAIALVGGETIFAKTSKIRVVRSGGGETVVYQVNLNAIRAGDLSTNILLATGDIVYVSPTVLAKIGYAVNAVLFPFQPFMGVGNAFAGSVFAN